MRVVLLVCACAILAIGMISCQVSKPYIMETDRVDQNLRGGNRGYLKGAPPPPEDRRGLKRPLIAVDIDLPEIGPGNEAEASEVTAAEDEMTASEDPKPAAGEMEERIVEKYEGDLIIEEPVNPLEEEIK